MTTHINNCDCKDCKYFGGAKHLFKIFKPEYFTDIRLARVYKWLEVQLKDKGTCQLMDLNFEDPTAPKMSEITQCHLDSYAEDKDGKYVPLKEIITI